VLWLTLWSRSMQLLFTGPGKPFLYITNHLDQLSLPQQENQVPAYMARVKEECVYLCWMTGNTV